MELPHLGKHCSEKTCRLLDFLPMKCDACSQIFCKDHLHYDDHNCSSSYKKNIQVPVCPLCNQPIPVARDQVPDIAVSAHIENNCQIRSKEKVFSNRCNKTKCKKKELVPLICDTCKLNFCLTHRHPADHDCQGPKKPSNRAAEAAAARSRVSTANTGQSKISEFFSGPFRQADRQSSEGARSVSRQQVGGSRPQLSAAAAAAINRQTGRGSTPGRPVVARAANGGMSEDEALAAALAASLGGPSVAGNQPSESDQLSAAEQEDMQLAMALAESERLAAGGQTATTGGDKDKSCRLQ